MADCLRTTLLYSEKRPRDALFRIIEQLLKDCGRTGEPMILSRLTREAARRARLAIPPGITAQATPVAGLRDGYQDITEAFLLETVVRRLGDVTTRDHRSLAHALFRQFDRDVPIEDLEDRVVILLAQLADRIELLDDTYVARVS